MKNLLLVLFLCAPTLGFNQIILTWNSDEMRFNLDENQANKKKIIINYIKQGNLEVHTINVDNNNKIAPCANGSNNDDPINESLANDDVDIFYEIDCQNQIVEVYPHRRKTEAFKFKYCASKNEFIRDGEDCTNEENRKKKFSDITDIPIPHFESKSKDEFLYHCTNRYLFVDAHPDPFFKRNNSLYKRIKSAPTVTGADANRTIRKQFRKARSIPVNGSISVFIRELNFEDLENLSVSINSIDYSFDKDVSYLIAKLKEAKDQDEKTDGDIEPAAKIEGASISRKTYLQAVKDIFDALEYLNINDLYVVEAFKETLQGTIENEENKIELSEEEHILYSYILSWYPEYTSITPIAMTIPDSDEVDIFVSIKNKSNSSPKVYKVGTYKTSRALSVSVGGTVFITDLKNNNVFTQSFKDSLGVVDSIIARIDSTKTSIGIGMNSELMFRTGSWFRPSLNLGFFVPFEEELNPFLTFGPGISIINKRVKFSISTGLTYGKINDIASRYKNQNIVDLENLTNESISEKVWKRGWYYSLGISFNISDK